MGLSTAPESPPTLAGLEGVVAALLLLGMTLSGSSSARSFAAQPVRTYTVISGDTLSKIAAKTGVSVADLVSLNGIANPNLIRVGQVLRLDPERPPTPEPEPEPPTQPPTVPVLHPNAPELPGRSRRRARPDPAALVLAKTSRSAKPVRTAVAARHLGGVRSVSGARTAGTRLRGGVL